MVEGGEAREGVSQRGRRYMEVGSYIGEKY